MPESIEVRLSERKDRFLAYGGSPGGRDQVHNTIRRWPGWRRLRAAGRLGDATHCSIYSGPLSAVSVDRIAHTSLVVTRAPGVTEAMLALDEQQKGIALALQGNKAFRLRSAYETERQPMPHQLNALAALHIMGRRAILADDMGLGKTSTALWSLAGATRLLILCPQSVKLNWADEIEATLAGWVALIVPSGRKARADLLMDVENASAARTRVAVICNYDLLIHLSDLHKGFLAGFVHGQGLICDESHYLKNEASQRTRLTRTLFAPAEGGARDRLLLSGTPIRNTIEDIYAQIELVRPGTWTSKTDFDNRHLVIVPTTIGNRTFRQVQGVKDLVGLNQIVNTLQVRRKKEEVLDLPPKVHTRPRLSLEDDAAIRRIYKGMKDFAVLLLSELDGDMNIFQPQARTAVQAALRCEQIAQGFCGGIPEYVAERLGDTINKNAEKIPGRPNELMFPQHPKVRWLLENVKTLMDTGHKVVIYSRFLAPMFWLRDRLLPTAHAAMLYGGLTAEEKAARISRFREIEVARVLLCQVTIAEGFNLTPGQRR